MPDPFIIGSSIIFIVTARSQIYGAICDVFNYVYDYFIKEIHIDIKSNPKLVFAINQTISSLSDEKSKITASDGSKNVNYKLHNGTYSISNTDISISIAINNEKIVISSFLYSIDDIKKYLDKIYKKYCVSDNFHIFFTSENDRWSFPIFRTNRNIKLSDTITNQKILADLEFFRNNHHDYIQNGIPYRRGYLFQGNPGTGKTTFIEKISMDLQMSVYLVNLNANNMDDAILINLIAKIPCNSIIAFEEIDKQWDRIDNNNTKNITLAGLLSAIDGPQRISDGCIIIMTANNKDFLDGKGRNCLIREGRIDRVFDFV